MIEGILAALESDALVRDLFAIGGAGFVTRDSVASTVHIVASLLTDQVSLAVIVIVDFVEHRILWHRALVEHAENRWHEQVDDGVHDVKSSLGLTLGSFVAARSTGDGENALAVLEFVDWGRGSWGRLVVAGQCMSESVPISSSSPASKALPFAVVGVVAPVHVDAAGDGPAFFLGGEGIA